MNFIRNSSWKTVCGWHLYNPLRYRGYVYDTDTGLYYLQSRYYDPEMGRFLNADAFVVTGQGVAGNNMYTYCINNPISYSDYSGKLPRKNIVNINDGCPMADYIWHLRQVAEFESKWERRVDWLKGTADKVAQTAEVAWSSLEVTAGFGLGLQCGGSVLDTGIVVGMYGSNATIRLDDGSVTHVRELNHSFSAEIAFLCLGVEDSEFIKDGETVSRDLEHGVYWSEPVTLFDFSFYAGPSVNLRVHFNVVEFVERMMEID